MTDRSKDVFICHTSADKESIVRPLAKLLKSASISYWLDEAEIQWGDSIAHGVNEGLRISRYVIVVLSPSIIGRTWPEHEMNSALNAEASSGEVQVLPLLAGSHGEQQRLLQQYPLISGKHYLRWPDESDRIVSEINARLGRSNESDVPQDDDRYRVPKPKLRRDPSDLQRSRFTTETLTAIREYFEAGLNELQRDDHVDTELVDIHAQKFICRLYVDGQLRKSCKVWLGGMGEGYQISYAEGRQIETDQDNSYNSWLTQPHNDLVWEPFSANFGDMKSIDSPREAAIYFWQCFIADVE